jgi:hypothetical protein
MDAPGSEYGSGDRRFTLGGQSAIGQAIGKEVSTEIHRRGIFTEASATVGELRGLTRVWSAAGETVDETTRATAEQVQRTAREIEGLASDLRFWVGVLGAVLLATLLLRAVLGRR